MSRERVYGIDDLGRLVAIDAKTGALLGRMPTVTSTHALVNDQTDRIYLLSPGGMIQCLHELGAEQPLLHTPPPAKPEEQVPSETTQPAETPAETVAPTTEPATEDEASPFGDAATETEDTGEAATTPNDETAEGLDDNPFEFGE